MHHTEQANVASVSSKRTKCAHISLRQGSLNSRGNQSCTCQHGRRTKCLANCISRLIIWVVGSVGRLWLLDSDRHCVGFRPSCPLLVPFALMVGRWQSCAVTAASSSGCTSLLVEVKQSCTGQPELSSLASMRFTSEEGTNYCSREDRAAPYSSSSDCFVLLCTEIYITNRKVFSLPPSCTL